MIDEAAIGERFRALSGELNERQRRLWAAAEARSAGYGGILVEQSTVVDPERLGPSVGRLDGGELAAVDSALSLILGL